MSQDSFQRGMVSLLERVPELPIITHVEQSLSSVLTRDAVDALKTNCCQCNHKDTCEFAFESYNVDVVPGIDCLAAK